MRAARAKALVRAADVVGRYGGDELVVVMPDCGADEAYEVAERIRRAVADRPVLTGAGTARPPSASAWRTPPTRWRSPR